MSKGVRVIGPDRAQLRWEMVDLDSQLPDDHRARLVWGFVEGLDLSEFYDRIKARDAVAGRPATDPQVVLAVWLYATLEGIGSPTPGRLFRPGSRVRHHQLDYRVALKCYQRGAAVAH